MLNIPNQIINLFKTDSVRKNFRVHFPNGENADLTNSDIVAGSVQFTESICSKDVLQFGLAESSRIQFECVNVQNIYGTEIECGIEIDTSSLSAGDISTIQGNPGDGTLVLENDSDIGYGFYRVPYGVFTVTNCPRSAGAMWKRKVEAYEKNAVGGVIISPFLKNKYNCYFNQGSNTKMVQNMALIMADISQNIDALNATQTEVTMLTNGNIIKSDVSWQYQNSTIQVRFIQGSPYKNANAFVTSTNDSVYKITCSIDYTVIDQILEKIDSYGVPKSIRDFILAELTYGYNANDGYDTSRGMFPFDNQEDTGYFYPYVNNASNAFGIYLNIGAIATVEVFDGNNTYSYTLGNPVSDFHLYRYQTTDTNLLHENIQIDSNGSSPYGVTYFGSLDITKLAESYAELNAQFRKDDRTGNAEYVTLSKSSPISLDLDDYSELWWDEFNISPIGTVNIKYYDIDLGAEQNYIYNFGDGVSVYDMTDNYFLSKLSVSASDLNDTVENFVKGLIDTYFIPNIQDIAFTPVTLDMLGLPFLESGDYLEIDDGNNGTVGTYIMNHTISGEQFLFDDIESKGGEIIGDVRNA